MRSSCWLSPSLQVVSMCLLIWLGNGNIKKENRKKQEFKNHVVMVLSFLVTILNMVITSLQGQTGLLGRQARGNFTA